MQVAEISQAQIVDSKDVEIVRLMFDGSNVGLGPVQRGKSVLSYSYLW